MYHPSGLYSPFSSGLPQSGYLSSITSIEFTEILLAEVQPFSDSFSITSLAVH